MSLTDNGSSPEFALSHSASITRYCGWVSPSGSSNGRYTASTARFVMASAKHTWRSSASGSTSAATELVMLSPYHLDSALINRSLIICDRCCRRPRRWCTTPLGPGPQLDRHPAGESPAALFPFAQVRTLRAEVVVTVTGINNRVVTETVEHPGRDVGEQLGEFSRLPGLAHAAWEACLPQQVSACGRRGCTAETAEDRLLEEATLSDTSPSTPCSSRLSIEPLRTRWWPIAQVRCRCCER